MGLFETRNKALILFTHPLPVREDFYSLLSENILFKERYQLNDETKITHIYAIELRTKINFQNIL